MPDDELDGLLEEAEGIRRRHKLQGNAASYFMATDEEVLNASGAGTGKTFSELVKLDEVCEANPNSRHLLMRETRASLSDTVLPDWEDEILWPGHPAITGTAQREHRERYTYPNGATVRLGSGQHIDRVLSGKYDSILFVQAEETAERKWQKLLTRLRSFRMVHPVTREPYQQATADVNPREPTWWGLGRVAEGLMRRIDYRHHDNPAWYDAARGEWTEKGRRYLSTLHRLRGVERERLLKHLWVRAEGLVWETYDQDRHLIYGELEWDERRGRWQLHAPMVEDRAIVLEWFGCSVDFGWRVPCCGQVWGFDCRGRAFLVAEVYHSRKSIHWLAGELAALYERFRGFRVGVTDWNQEARAVLNREISQVGGQDEELDAEGEVRVPGLFQPWSKARTATGEKAGVDVVRTGFEHDKVFLVRDARVHAADPRLLALHHPTCTAEEIVGYVLSDEPEDPDKDPKEDPRKARDHGCDAMRGMLHWAFGRSLVKQPKIQTYGPETIAGSLFGGEWDRILKGQGRRRRPKPGTRGYSRRRGL